MRQIHKALQEVFDDPTRRGVAKAFLALYKNQPLTTIGLVTNTVAVNWGSTAGLVLVDGITVQVAANAAFPALTGLNLANGQIGVAGFGVDKFGTLYTFINPVPVASYGALRYPAPPDTKDGVLVVGYVVISDVTAGAFTGGTTSLATAGLTLTYINEVDAFYAVNDYGSV
jgi:hypothetical protein